MFTMNKNCCEMLNYSITTLIKLLHCNGDSARLMLVEIQTNTSNCTCILNVNMITNTQRTLSIINNTSGKLPGNSSWGCSLVHSKTIYMHKYNTKCIVCNKSKHYLFRIIHR